jgi:hypothetical protein
VSADRYWPFQDLTVTFWVTLHVQGFFLAVAQRGKEAECAPTVPLIMDAVHAPVLIAPGGRNTPIDDPVSWPESGRRTSSDIIDHGLSNTGALHKRTILVAPHL